MSGCYVVFHKQLGDLLLMQPTFERLQAHHGGKVAVMTRGGHAPLLELMPQPTELYQRSSVRHRSCVYCFDTLNKSAWRTILTPAVKRYCIVPDPNELAWFHRFLFSGVIVPGLKDRYVAEYFWSNVPVPANGEFRPPTLMKPPDTWRPPDIGDGPFLLLSPTSGWRRKSWSPYGWTAVMEALHQAGAPSAVMTSTTTPWQLEHCDKISQRAGTSIRWLDKPTSMQNYLWLCANAEMVLSVDGSAAHLAAAFGVRNLSLFGPTSVQNWHYPTRYSRALIARIGKDGTRRTRDLPVADVVNAALELWAGTPS